MLKLSDNVIPASAKEAAMKTLAAGIEDPEAIQGLAEATLAAHLKVPPEWVLLTNSATSALHIAYKFLLEGRRPQVPVFTWPATFTAAGRYQLVDADPYPYFHDEDSPFRVGVEMWGRPWNMGHVHLLDSSHRFGGGIDALRSDTTEAVIYSFGPRKEIPCMRGGAVISKRIDNRWRAYRDSGTMGPHSVYPHGLNLEISELSAALLHESLPYHQQNYDKRGCLLNRYIRNLSGSVPCLTGPLDSGHLMVVRLNDYQRDAVAWALKKEGIQSGVHYRYPLWLKPTKFPRAYELSQHVLSLPLHLNMDESDVDRVCEVVKGAM